MIMYEYFSSGKKKIIVYVILFHKICSFSIKLNWSIDNNMNLQIYMFIWIGTYVYKNSFL